MTSRSTSFVGGTVYQAYLSATNYHRWHAPVAGTIVRAFVRDGTYYSEADSEGAEAVEPQDSQSYLAHVATWAIILIQADDPVIGLMAFVPVGMSEVSSCIVATNVTPDPTSPKATNSATSSSAARPTASCSVPALSPTSPSRQYPSRATPRRHWCLSAPSSPQPPHQRARDHRVASRPAAQTTPIPPP